MLPIPTAHRVPRGMLRAASRRSPLMLTPARIPVTAGKKIAKIDQKPWRAPGWPGTAV